MKTFRKIYISLIIILSLITTYFVSWNRGFDYGYEAGFTEAVLDGKVEVHCDFKGQK